VLATELPSYVRRASVSSSQLRIFDSICEEMKALYKLGVRTHDERQRLSVFYHHAVLRGWKLSKTTTQAYIRGISTRLDKDSQYEIRRQKHVSFFN
jgi:hypothetical protein